MARGKVEIDVDRCKGCGLCIEVCPRGRLRVSGRINAKGYYPAEFIEAEGKEGCTGCCLCAIVCPDVAIEVYRG